MRAPSTIARGTRHIVGVGLQAVLLAAIVATVALAMSAFYKPAGFVAGVNDVAAARGGKPALAAAGSSISLDANSNLTLGGQVTFTTFAAGLKGPEWPMVLVSCYDAAGDKVYAQLDHPDAAFVLGGGASQWRDRGGSADCAASLYAYGGQSQGVDSIRLLAGPVQFQAAG